MKTPILRLTFAAAALAALFFDLPAGLAFGNAPWCAVVDRGAGEVVWECEYRSAAACAPHVIAGNRGFCNVNPAWRGPRGRAIAAPYRRARSGSAER